MEPRGRGRSPGGNDATLRSATASPGLVEGPHHSALHAISVAATALARAWSRAASSRQALTRRVVELDRLRTEVALLAEELALKDERWERVHPHRRPHYRPVQRLRILELRAARGWSVQQTAERFHVSEETIMSWMRRLDESGEAGLVRADEPLNKFPAFVARLVRALKRTCPALGKKKIAQVLARAGLHLGVSTVGRMLEREISPSDVGAEMPIERPRSTTARRPNDIWHVDLTTVPTAAGFWVPWLPFARLQRWPFAWWVAVAVDHASRLVVGLAVFEHRPNSVEVTSFLKAAIERAKATPSTIITDRGRDFGGAFHLWCRLRGIRRRLGAVAEHGSIAIVERFIRSMKSECTRRILVPFQLAAMQDELDGYATWFNEHRPNEALGGRTPLEVHSRAPPANARPRYEPREHWPKRSRCASPYAPMKGTAGARLELVVRNLANKTHLPVITIRRAV
jgi:transposase InsO family protein